MATVKKAQKGIKTPMQIYKDKYPKADTTAKGDTRFGDEINAYAPKKVLDSIAAGDKAFNAKYGKNKPAVDKPKIKSKPTKIKAKMGMKVSKAQTGKKVKTLPNVTVNASTMNRGKKTVQTSPGGSYKMKTTTNAAGDTLKQVERRTVKGVLTGAPKARGVMQQAYKTGGKMTKAKSGMKMSKMSKKAC